jgi:hypothetical protein
MVTVLARWSRPAILAATTAAVLLGALLAMAAVGLTSVSAASSAGASTALRAGKAPKLFQLGHATFWECPAKTTELLIGVNQLTLHPKDILKIDFVVKNLGTAACNYVAPYAGATPGPTAPTLQVGPCGSIGFKIEGAHHKNVWPGVEPFNCPALGFAQLQPQASVIGSGQWGQTLPIGLKRVKPGSYTLVVGKNFSFPLKIDAH